MPKRRRERDKPKYAPDAAYDPNKRVLLSYGSDDEDVEAATKEVEEAAELAVDQSRLANYQMTEYPVDEEEGEVILGAAEAEVASKADPEGKEMATPAHQEQNGSMRPEMARDCDKVELEVDAAQRQPASRRHEKAGLFDTGQRIALGAISSEHDDEDEEGGVYDSTTEEAMAYLNSVRTERQAMPDILAAPRQVLDNYNGEGEENDADDNDDYPIEDGTYIAPPEPILIQKQEATDPQRVFTKCLRDRFMLQRKHLHMAANPAKLAELGKGFPISFDESDSTSRAQWHRVLGSSTPMPAQLRAMNQDTVFNLLAFLRESYLTKGRNIKNITSAWIWSLLCRLEDVGNMSNDQVFPLRELGKRAIFLQLHFSDPEAAAQLEALELQGQSRVANGDAQSNDEFNAADGAGLQHTKAHQAKATENTLATLDMILVVVGEVFGQRDLLEFRRPWTEAEAEIVT